jgi:microcystin-dependent protein
MNSAPTGWLATEGTAVSRSTYANLFAAIGTTYGSGDGSTTFNLPDLRGYFVRGSGTNSDSNTSGTFGAKQTSSIVAPQQSLVLGGDGGSGTDANFLVPKITTNNATNPTNYTNRGTVYSTEALGSGTETRPVNIAMLYCIKI